MIKVAVLCPVYKNVGFVAAQIANYYSFHKDCGSHVLHLADGADSALSNVAAYSDVPANVFVNRNSWPTSFRCVFGAILSNSLFMRENLRGDYTHVYIHTDADLLVHGNFLSCILNRDHGFSWSELSGKTGWRYYDQCMNDRRFSSLCSELKLTDKDLFFGRQEGAFFPASVWHDLTDLALEFFPRSSFEVEENHWPAEEVVIPTLASKLLGSEKARSFNMVSTKPLVKPTNRTDIARYQNVNVVQPADIENAIAGCQAGDCVGLKWFSRDADHAARRLVSSLVGC